MWRSIFERIQLHQKRNWLVMFRRGYRSAMSHTCQRSATTLLLVILSTFLAHVQGTTPSALHHVGPSERNHASLCRLKERVVPIFLCLKRAGSVRLVKCGNTDQYSKLAGHACALRLRGDSCVIYICMSVRLKYDCAC